MKLRVIVQIGLTALVSIHAVPAHGQALGTAVSYQGKLDASGAPANGLHDLRFQLFTLATGGSQVGATICVDGVNVVDGLFTVSLDFGAAYNGNQRFLQVFVRADSAPGNCSSGTYTTLTPRQPLTATPYALYALSGPGSGGPWTVSGNNIFNTNTGNVGIGTTTPGAPLDIRAPNTGALPGEGLRVQGTLTTVANQAYASFLNGAGTAIGYVGDGSTGDNNVFLASYVGDVTIGTPAGRVLNATAGGNVGVGIGTPQTRLHVHGQSMWLTGGNGGALPTSAGGGLRLYDDGVRGNIFAWNYANNTPRNLTFQEPGGNVGIGTTTPEDKLHVLGNIKAQGALRSVNPANTAEAFLGWTTDGAGNDMARIRIGGGAPGGYNGLDIQSVGNVSLMRIRGDGTTVVRVLEITGADLAEKFAASEKLEPGMVVAIDAKNAGKLCLARGAYNHCVAGVVSGANNFSVGAVLGNLPGHEDAPPIALSGRVYVQCDASNGAIEPGDLLTSSDTPGHAMKAMDRERSHGAVIGKAMERLESGRGLVLVLVNLQ